MIHPGPAFNLTGSPGQDMRSCQMIQGKSGQTTPYILTWTCSVYVMCPSSRNQYLFQLQNRLTSQPILQYCFFSLCNQLLPKEYNRKLLPIIQDLTDNPLTTSCLLISKSSVFLHQSSHSFDHHSKFISKVFLLLWTSFHSYTQKIGWRTLWQADFQHGLQTPMIGIYM